MASSRVTRLLPNAVLWIYIGNTPMYLSMTLDNGMAIWGEESNPEIGCYRRGFLHYLEQGPRTHLLAYSFNF
ncbi:hypothetical protein HanHA300_Chr15g0575221 [Helianthus annuus]|nr:hypothetical protein HanHA300_Chr15g0575221 [Helianthus annuus]KAJ0474011.1 hypothetical protein HanHA89_Chr15g0624911 [Helianthus annuus]KAJ0649579.1 hypothetical protein HanLR1_Chr15g0585941 [Helianthus annuus]